MNFYENYKWAQRLCVCFKFNWAFFSLMRILTIYVRQWSEACATTNNTLNKCNQQMSRFQFLFPLLCLLFHLLQNVVPLVLCSSVRDNFLYSSFKRNGNMFWLARNQIYVFILGDYHLNSINSYFWIANLIKCLIKFDKYAILKQQFFLRIH